MLFGFIAVTLLLFLGIAMWFMDLAVIGAGCTRIPRNEKVRDINVGITDVTVFFKDGSDPYLGEEVGEFEIISHWPIRLLKVTKSDALFRRKLRDFRSQGFLVLPDSSGNTKYISMELVASFEVNTREHLVNE